MKLSNGTVAALGFALMITPPIEKLAAAGICEADSTSKIGKRATVTGKITYIANDRKSLNLDDGKCEILVLVNSMPTACAINQNASMTGTVVEADEDEVGLVSLKVGTVTCR